jgi:hypothetical protein
MIRFRYRYWNLGDRAASSMLTGIAEWLVEQGNIDLDLNLITIDIGDNEEKFKEHLVNIKFERTDIHYVPAYSQFFIGKDVKIYHVASDAIHNWMDDIYVEFERDDLGIIFKLTFPKEKIIASAEYDEKRYE